MEMHQVRYFLAVSRELNFTRAAEECNVAQPSLTRAVKQLEEELGNELFRRERNLSHLTEFGQRMLPLLQQCYDSAASAKALATSLKTGAVAPLSIALSIAVDIAVLLPQLRKLMRTFEGLELRFLRGSPRDVAEFLKKGEAELGVSGPLGEAWDRLDAWPLFTEGFTLAVGMRHRLAGRSAVYPGELAKERLLLRTHCELDGDLQDFLKGRQIHSATSHKMVSEHDLLALIEAGFGVGVLPESAPKSDKVKLIPIDGLDLKRTVYLYSVAGRRRAAAASALINYYTSDCSSYAA